MFFSSRKKKKLAEEAQKMEQQRLQEEAIQKAKKEADAYHTNLDTFYRICDMVRSLPKKRQIVVVQRKNTFKTKSDRNWCYMQIAQEMKRQYRLYGKTWMIDYNDSLYAFYAPTKVDYKFRRAIEEFSKEGYLIQHIRYYSFNYWITFKRGILK